jgi:hypothetical protein
MGVTAERYDRQILSQRIREGFHKLALYMFMRTKKHCNTPRYMMLATAKLQANFIPSMDYSVYSWRSGREMMRTARRGHEDARRFKTYQLHVLDEGTQRRWGEFRYKPFQLFLRIKIQWDSAST